MKGLTAKLRAELRRITPDKFIDSQTTVGKNEEFKGEMTSRERQFFSLLFRKSAWLEKIDPELALGPKKAALMEKLDQLEAETSLLMIALRRSIKRRLRLQNPELGFRQGFKIVTLPPPQVKYDEKRPAMSSALFLKAALKIQDGPQPEYHPASVIIIKSS